MSKQEDKQEKLKTLLGPVATLFRKEFRRKNLPITESLESALSQMESGDPVGVQGLSQGTTEAVCSVLADSVEKIYGEKLVIDSAVEALRQGRYKESIESLFEATFGLVADDGMPVYSPQFFSRDANIVAKELCGSNLMFTGKRRGWTGLITETAGYDEPSKKDKKTAESLPGTIGVWPAQGKQVLIISAHEPGDAATVAVWAMSHYDSKWSMGQIGANLNIGEREGEIIGSPGYDLVLLPRDPSTDSVGHLLVNPTNAGKGESSAYKLIKQAKE